MRPGPRRLTWNEFKQLHSHLNESEILKLFNIEEERWRLFEAEEKRIIEIKNQKIVDKAQALNNQLIDAFTSRGGFVPKPNPNPPVETYSTPGAFNLTIPDSGIFKKYNQVTIEAVGGGGVGTRGKAPASAIWIGAGGGGGAYSKKTYPITEVSVIAITVGAGSSTHEVNGEESRATVDGVTITAGGGESLIINNEDVNGNPIIFSEIEGPASGGTASGGDVNINGNDGEPGQARFNGGSPPPSISGPPDGIGDGGAGAGPFGGAGGITSKYKTIVGGQPDNSGGYTDDYAKATNGQQPGGGGGGGGPRQSLYYTYPLTPGNGGDGQIKVTYGYS